MVLPVIDVGLMNEHLSTHEGLLGKLDVYLTKHLDEYLTILITTQQLMLKTHIRVMLELLNPHREEWIYLPNLQLEEKLDPSWQIDSSFDRLTKPLTIELQSTAKTMAHTNFNSALMMKNENVKHVHFEMAAQQATYMNYINYYIKEKGWAFSVQATPEAQSKIVEHFNQLI